jgi:hypothetical protein
MTIKAWQGPSTIDGKDIMAVVSCEKRPSKNVKTGDMVQVSFFSTAEKPVVAAHETGDDESVCGSCLLRPSIWTEEVSDEPCYVGLHWKSSQWNAAMALKEDLEAAQEAMTMKPVRFGEYGNMSSIPREVAEALFGQTRKWTLYEHEWRKESNQWLQRYAMASVHSLEEAREARAMGWRTYRITGEGEGPADGEIECPFKDHNVQCRDCLLCDGKRDTDTREDKRKSITAPAH